MADDTPALDAVAKALSTGYSSATLDLSGKKDAAVALSALASDEATRQKWEQAVSKSLGNTRIIGIRAEHVVAAILAAIKREAESE